jgi:hypothetical protein
MEFTYETVNDALDERHPQLSGWWTAMGWDEEVATVYFDLETTGEEVSVTVDRNGTVTAPPELIAEMDEIQRERDARLNRG